MRLPSFHDYDEDVTHAIIRVINSNPSTDYDTRYNSAVFSTIAANDYVIFEVPETFITSKVANVSDSYHIKGSIHSNYDPRLSYNGPIDAVQTLQERLGSYERLSYRECINVYSQEYQTTRRDVVVVSEVDRVKGKEVINVLQEIVKGDNGDPFRWICRQMRLRDNGPCKDALGAMPESVWESPMQYKYCLSQRVEERCKVQFSFDIMVIVIICNLVKAVSMLLTVSTCKAPPLVTVGDAVASFLTTPDARTKGFCLATRADYARGWPAHEARRWFKTSPRWFKAASARRWCIGTGL